MVQNWKIKILPVHTYSMNSMILTHEFGFSIRVSHRSTAFDLDWTSFSDGSSSSLILVLAVDRYSEFRTGLPSSLLWLTMIRNTMRNPKSNRKYWLHVWKVYYGVLTVWVWISKYVSGVLSRPPLLVLLVLMFELSPKLSFDSTVGFRNHIDHQQWARTQSNKLWDASAYLINVVIDWIFEKTYLIYWIFL